MEFQNDCYKLNLDEEATQILREARMIIPGIQTIFGFQLIAVFSDGFASKLENHHEIIHLLAMMMVLTAMALVMSPAAYQRRVEPRQISVQFVRLASKMLTWGLRMLALGLIADIGVIAYAVTEKESAALVLSFLALFILGWLWFFLGTPLRWSRGSAALDAANRHFTGIRNTAIHVSHRHYTRIKTSLIHTGLKYLN